MALNLQAKNNHICLRDTDLHVLSEQYDSPFFLYDFDQIKQRINVVKRKLGENIKLYYSAKANPSIEILRKILPLVDGVDISSGGELRQVLKAGFAPIKVSFAGPGKTDKELSSAISESIGSINVESLNELKRIEKIADRLGKRVNVSIRINPMQEYKKFLITTGGKSSQFGIDEEKYRDFFSCLQGMNHCNYVGIHVFSGSQCLDEETLIENIAYILQIAKKVFNDTSIELKIINFGGGFGIPYYESEKEIDIDYVCSNITRQFKKFKQETGLSRCIGILELGRYLIAEAGAYIARVIDLKESRKKKICVLSGGMNHNSLATIKFGRPRGENLKILNLSNTDSSVKEQVMLVGPLCTSLDVIGESVEINKPAIGHYIAILNSGAYSYTASPLLFLSHDTPAELLLDEDCVKVIRKSYTVEMFNSKQ